MAVRDCAHLLLAQVVAALFGIHQSDVSRMFITWIDLLYVSNKVRSALLHVAGMGKR